MKKFFGFFSLIIFLSIYNLYAQEPPMQPMVQIPPSPNAASLGKYADYPVSLNTGTVSISVPIYTIQTRYLSVPISISYHGSGIKVGEKASDVGLGWSLNAGGVINRSLKGTPDEWGTFFSVPLAQADTLGYFGDPNKIICEPGDVCDELRRMIMSFRVEESVMTEEDLVKKHYLDNVVRFKTIDTEPDDFSFNFNGRSGGFIFDNEGNIHSTEYEALKIEEDLVANDQITITSEDGTVYNFGMDSNGDHAIEETLPSGATPNISSFVNIDHTASWYLAEIISPNKLDTIKFKYQNFLDSEMIFSQQFSTIDIKYDFDDGQPIYPYDCKYVETNHATATRNSIYLSEIVFPNGKVVFNSVQDRLDYGKYRLDNIVVYSKQNNNYIKQSSYVLDNNHYFNRNNSGININNVVPNDSRDYKSLKLDNLIILGKNDTEKGRYSFTYNSTLLPNIYSTAQDYWGYYNGELDNNSLVPQAVYSNCEELFNQTYAADRSANSSYMKAGVLEKIKYPTGGITKFLFEPNYIGESTTVENVTHHEESAMAVGVDPEVPNLTHTPYIETPFTAPEFDTDVLLTYELSPWSCTPGGVGYTYVQLIDVTNANEIIFSMNHYGDNEPQGTNVIKSGGTSVTLIGGHQYKIAAFVGNSCKKTGDNNNIIGTSYASLILSWNTYNNTSQMVAVPVGGLRIKSIKHYKNETDTQPSLLKRYEYGTTSYQGYGIGRLLYDYKNNVTRSVSFNGDFYDYMNYGSNTVDIQTNNGSAVEYDKVTEFVDDNGDGGKIEYYYNSSIANFSGIPIRNSPYPSTPRLTYPKWHLGKLRYQTTFSKKDGEYIVVATQSNTYTDLYEKRIGALKAQVISTFGTGETGLGIVAFNYDIIIGNNSLTKSVTSSYDYDGNLITSATKELEYEPEFFLEEKVKSDLSSGEKLRSEYTYSHTETNPSSVDIQLKNAHRLVPALKTKTYKENNDSTEELLTTQNLIFKDWGQNYLGTSTIVDTEKIQVSKGSNPLFDKVVYDNYYDDGNPQEAHRADGTHEVYIWGYNHQHIIAKIENAQFSDVPVSLYNSIVSKSDLDDSDSDEDLLRAELNKLRNSTYAPNLSGSMVTTFTYDPLIGVTSITDPRGITTYYEYDEFNRLKEVKDTNKNVLSHEVYHYKGQ